MTIGTRITFCRMGKFFTREIDIERILEVGYRKIFQRRNWGCRPVFLMERSSPAATLSIKKKTACRITSHRCDVIRQAVFLFSFRRLFPLPDAFRGVPLTGVRFSDGIRSEGGRLHPKRICPPDLALLKSCTTTFATGLREQATGRMDLSV